MSFDIEWAHPSITPKDVESVTNALNNGLPRQLQEQLEAAFVRLTGAPHAVGVSSLGCAYQALYTVLNVGPADQLITTPLTPIVAVAAALARGARLILIDLDEADYRQYLQPRTRGRSILLISHYAGNPAPVDLIEQLLTSPDDILIEEASDALGATYRDGTRVGASRWSRITLFDLQTRTITGGNGALCTTQDQRLAEQLYQLRDRMSARLNPLAAALALSQVDKLERFIKRRRHVIDWYRQRLVHPAIHLPSDTSHSACAFLPLQIDWSAFRMPRDRLIHDLHLRGIETRLTQPLHQLLNLERQFPAADHFAAQLLELPAYPALTEYKVEKICSSILA
jgi:perosamine synthetase